MNKKLASKIKTLPQKPGVYMFLDHSGRILYIGKTINLKNRVQSHFRKDADFYKGDWLRNISDIDCIKTADEKEALILENQLIKKYRPKYNIQWRDDKSYFRVAFTDEEWPRVRAAHQPSLRGAARSDATKQSRTIAAVRGIARLPKSAARPAMAGGQASPRQGVVRNDNSIGPFVNGRELKQILRSLRKIFPYRTCKNSYDKPCLQWHLGLCPAHETTNNKQRMANRKFYPGRNQEAQMANSKYRQSLNSLRQFLRLYAGEPIRIEAYDISNIQGAYATGSMIVFEGDKPKKFDYRRFKIKTVRGANDIAMIKEILRRRLNHYEWPNADLILIDGGRAQLRAAVAVLGDKDFMPGVVALAKKEEELYTEYSGKTLKLSALPLSLRLLFGAIRDEAHRFAIFYYRHLHGKQFRRTPKKAHKRS
jgi:excinuclease ABC subunit C